MKLEQGYNDSQVRENRERENEVRIRVAKSETELEREREENRKLSLQLVTAKKDLEELVKYNEEFQSKFDMLR